MSGKPPEQLRADLESLGWQCDENVVGEDWQVTVARGGLDNALGPRWAAPPGPKTLASTGKISMLQPETASMAVRATLSGPGPGQINQEKQP